MTDTWQGIFAEPLPSPEPVPAHQTPIARTPTCPAQCSGRHTVETCLGCPSCGARLYRVWAHEWAHTESHYFYTQDRLDGAPPGRTTCPACGTSLQRMTP